MSNQLKLMAILGHPDDESLGTGGILAKYASEGIQTYLVTATRGERGWFGPAEENPGLEEVGRIREKELRAAAETLGLEEVNLLDYVDGDFDQAEADQVIGQLVGHIRRIQPDVVVTFDQNGLYGHPDHIAICQYASAAVVAAADPFYADISEYDPHRVSKLYYMVWNDSVKAAFESAFGELAMDVDGEKRLAVTWPDWAITTRIDTSAYWEQVWDAISCHRSQLPGYQVLKTLPAEHHKSIWGSQLFHRAFSTVNGGPAKEDDLFAGLR
ncbi:MAG: PIG-L family deacetylase [Chloroflexi bacterium]|nr:PIG-L family deacetylase [Chloroflexota bacterium]